ncbi:MAG: hypothetical protein JXR40_14225 [Pontiellaceae bacterium]|nr:hypothetical protein [Pontiellaceae bacterium]
MNLTQYSTDVVCGTILGRRVQLALSALPGIVISRNNFTLAHKTILRAAKNPAQDNGL